MNDELKTTEYLKKLEQIKLSDSSRTRIKGELMQYARFHAVAEGKTNVPIRSPFFAFFFKPAGMAFAIMLVVGATSLLLSTSAPTGQLSMNKNQTEGNDTAPQGEGNTIKDSEDLPASDSPTILASNNNPQPGTISGDVPAQSAREKVASESAADTASDEMSIMLSQGTWSIEDYTTNIKLRETALRGLIKKYDTELKTDIKTEFNTKLDQASLLVAEAEGKSEEDARANLDKASVLVGEVEATLSTLGQVKIENGIIVDINFE